MYVTVPQLSQLLRLCLKKEEKLTGKHSVSHPYIHVLYTYTMYVCIYSLKLTDKTRFIWKSDYMNTHTHKHMNIAYFPEKSFCTSSVFIFAMSSSVRGSVASLHMRP